MERMILL